jgi:hypothetical protein
MKGVDLDGQVRRAVYVEGLSQREAARRFGIDLVTTAKGERERPAITVSEHDNTPARDTHIRWACVVNLRNAGCDRRFGAYPWA